ncbi:MAG: helix-turn-helix domain-containing protein [Actinomycetota bacterium]
MSDERPVYQCPVEAPLAVLGGKWKLVLLFYLLQEPRRNGELRRLVPNITQKMLTQQLRELEADGIIDREVFEQVPPKVLYHVVETERPYLETVLGPLCEWGLRWAEKTNARILALEAMDATPDTP